MYEGCVALLKMLRVYLEGEVTDPTVNQCRIVSYDPREESFSMLLEEGDLTRLSLDAEYCCEIEAEHVECQGRIRERYFDKDGQKFTFVIENGFYKNNLN